MDELVTREHYRFALAVLAESFQVKVALPSRSVISRLLAMATRWVWQPRYASTLCGAAEGWLSIDDPIDCRSSLSQAVKAAGSARRAKSLKKCRVAAWKVWRRPYKNRR